MPQITVIFPGSFDPVHLGHIRLAAYVAALPQVRDVWLLPSRRNPLKSHDVIAGDADRLAMLRIAADSIPGLHVSDLELSLPFPSYSVTTLRELQRCHPDRHFRLLIGSDNWADFPRWRLPETILHDFGLYIYPRPGYPLTETLPSEVTLLSDAPVFPFSSTEVRSLIASEASTQEILDPRVADYIRRHNLYQPDSNDTIL